MEAKNRLSDTREAYRQVEISRARHNYHSLMIKRAQASRESEKEVKCSHVSTVGFPNLVNLASTARTVSMTFTASCG